MHLRVALLGALVWPGAGSFSSSAGNATVRRLETIGQDLPAVRIEWTRSPDAVGWSKSVDPLHDQAAPCIHPAPYGQQCTVHLVDALASCLFLNCRAVVCPDQGPYAKGKPLKGIKGPICQIRNHADRNEIKHGMCKPGGCTKWVMERGSAGALLSESSRAAVMMDYPHGRSVSLALILPGLFLQYECKGIAVPPHSASPASTGFCGCLDVSAHGLEVVHKKTLSGIGSLVCLLSGSLPPEGNSALLLTTLSGGSRMPRRRRRDKGGH